MKIYFGLKGRVNFRTQSLILALIIISCAPTPSSMAKTNPIELIEKADSLILKHPTNIELRNAIVAAHLNLAKKSNDPNDYKSILKFDPKNKSANYFINIQKGKNHHKKGHKNGQWDAIQSFAKAAALIDTLGEAYYWLGQAYEKKDEMDMRFKTNSARLALLNRKKTYEDFWK